MCRQQNIKNEQRRQSSPSLIKLSLGILAKPRDLQKQFNPELLTKPSDDTSIELNGTGFSLHLDCMSLYSQRLNDFDAVIFCS